MRIAALLVAGAAMTAVAHAQSAQGGVQFLPIPDVMPPYLFAPHPLSGSLLEPFVPRKPHAAPIEPVPGPDPVVVAHTEAGGVSAPAFAEAPAESAPAATEPGASTGEGGAPPAPPAPKFGTVTVIVENVESDSGTVDVAVCNKGLSREGCPYSHKIPATRGFVETEFDNIPPGRYAVVSYHDVNGNNQFDKLFGMPREPYALSNNAGEKLIPTFNDAALAINPGANSVIIRLQHLGG